MTNLTKVLLARKMWNLNNWWDILSAAFCNLARFDNRYVKKKKNQDRVAPWLWLLPLVRGGRWHATCNTWHVICDMWHITHDIFSSSFLSVSVSGRCYYLHTSRYSVSPVCGILTNNKIVRYIMFSATSFISKLDAPFIIVWAWRRWNNKKKRWTPLIPASLNGNVVWRADPGFSQVC